MNLWDELSKRLTLSRKFVKQETYLMLYGGGDPWTNYFIKQELDRLEVALSLMPD